MTSSTDGYSSTLGGVSSSILEQGKSLLEKVFGGRRVLGGEPLPDFTLCKDRPTTPATLTVPAALPFRHPVFDQFFQDVSLQVETEHVEPAAVAVFRDLHHWHTYKPVATRKTRVEVLPWVKKIRQKRRQILMADVVSYAASLTSPIGKVFDRETIVVNSRPLHKSACAPPQASLGNSNRNRGGSRLVGVRGKERALLTSQQLREEKAQTKRNDVLRLWAEKCAEFENDKDLVMCYLKAQEFQNPRFPGSHAVVRPPGRPGITSDDAAGDKSTVIVYSVVLWSINWG
jgi:hypothetical protein